MTTRPRDRQLRLVHLQPRPVPGRARRRDRGRPQRQGDGRRAARATARASGRSRPVPARRPRRGSRSRPRAASPRPGSPTLGVCLGHQSMVEAFGGEVIQGDPVHGKDAEISHDGRSIFAGLPDPLLVGPLPLADRRARPARRARAHLDLRRRRDGGPSPRAAGRGRPVPPRVGADPARQGHARELPRARRRRVGSRRMPNEIITRAIDAVGAGEHLTADHASAVLAEIMEGRASEVQTAAFLIALRAKGETVPELVGLARTMRSLAAPGRDRPRRPRRHGRDRRRTARPSTSRRPRL